MRRILLPLCLLLLVLAVVLFVTKAPEEESPDLKGAPIADATERAAITLRGRPTADSATETPAAMSPVQPPAPDDAEVPATPVPLVVRIVLEGHPEDAPLDPPATIQVAAATDPIDSFMSLAIMKEVRAAGSHAIDVRRVLGEVGRLGRAPELSIHVHRPGGLLHGRSLLVPDADGLLAGRGRLDPLTVVLRTTTRVRGRILARDGTSMARSVVLAYRLRGGVPDPVRVNALTAEEDGRFELGLPGEGPFLLVALASSWPESERGEGHRWLPAAEVVVLETGREPEPVAFALDAGRWVEGAVVHPTRNRVEGKGKVRWDLHESAITLHGEPSVLAWLGGRVVWAGGELELRDGRFRVQGLPDAACRFSLQALDGTLLGGAVSETVLPSGGERVELRSLGATLEIRAHVDEPSSEPAQFGLRVRPLDDGAPFWAGRASDGFRLVVAPHSTYRVEVADPRFESASIAVDVGAGGETTSVDVPLVASSGSELVVHLHNPDGSAYSGWAAIWVADPQSPITNPRRIVGTATHGKEGLYRLHGVPDGRWRLHVRPGRSTFWGRPPEYLERVQELITPAPREPAASLVVDVGARLIVRVADAEGRPRPGRIRITQAGGGDIPAVLVPELNFLENTERGAVGELPAASTCWLATALEPGTYRIEITPADGDRSVHTIQVNAGETAVISI